MILADRTPLFGIFRICGNPPADKARCPYMKERGNTGCQISRLLKDMQHKPVQEDEEFSCVIPGNAMGVILADL